MLTKADCLTNTGSVRGGQMNFQLNDDFIYNFCLRVSYPVRARAEVHVRGALRLAVWMPFVRPASRHKWAMVAEAPAMSWRRFLTRRLRDVVFQDT